MPIYDYRCQRCGRQRVYAFSMNHNLPEEINELHPAGSGPEPPADHAAIYCGGPLRRIWTAPNANFGYIPHKHTQNDQFAFQHFNKD